MTSLAPVPRICRSTGHVMPLVALALVSLGTAVIGVATIVADPVFVEAEIAVSHLEGPGATDRRPDADHEVDPNRTSASGRTGRPGSTTSLSRSRDDRHSSTHGNGAAFASHHEVRAYLLGTAMQLHAPASAMPSLPDCFPCPATGADAERHHGQETVGASTAD